MLHSYPTVDALDSFSVTFAEERSEVIRARRKSGLETIWQKAREQYQGLDDVNHKGLDGKARTLDGPVSTALGQTSNEKRSTVFVNITRPYTNAGTARVADILLPTGGKKNWDLKPTPVSDVAILGSLFTEYPEIGPIVPPTLLARLEQSEEERELAVNEARVIINDWLTESKWHSKTRNQITEAGKVGTGVLKGPYSKERKVSDEIRQVVENLSFSSDPAIGLVLHEEAKQRLFYQPALECIPVENCYPDMPSCGDDIQNGRFFWEEIPNVSKLQLQELIKDPTYLGGQLQQCLDEGPLPCKEKGETVNKEKKSYSRWRRTGEIDLTELTGDGGSVWAEIELVNNRVVKVSKPPLDTRRFQYNMLVWEPRQDSWAGIGIPEQIETPQRGLNASVRAGNDNLGWSVGFQLILGKGLEALDGNPEDIHAYKVWRDVTDSLAALTGKERSPKDAIGTIEFPNHLGQILPWIDFWLKMAESTTGLSLLMQGQKATDSVGVSQMMMNSATTNLRMFVKHWDDDVCTPAIQALYEWVQLYGPESAKSDAVAAPLGSSALVTRELQQQALVQLLDRTVQPVYGKSPRKTMDMFLEGMQFDPRQLDLDPEEEQKLEQAAAEPDAKVQVEELRSETDRLIAQMKNQTDHLKVVLDAQIKGASLDQALETVETQVAGSLAVEQMKQDGDREKEGQAPAPAPAPESPPLPSPEESLRILGLAE